MFVVGIVVLCIGVVSNICWIYGLFCLIFYVIIGSFLDYMSGVMNVEYLWIIEFRLGFSSGLSGFVLFVS